MINHMGYIITCIIGFVAGVIVCWKFKDKAVKTAKQAEADARAELEALKQNAIDKIKGI